MKLEVGKKYRDRMGNLVTISYCSEVAAYRYPYADNNGNTWTEEGMFRHGNTSNQDLIEEVQTNQEEEEMKHTFTMRCTLVVNSQDGDLTLEVYPKDQLWRKSADIMVLDDDFELVLSTVKVQELLLDKLHEEVTSTKQAYEEALDAVVGAKEFIRNL